MERRQRGAVRGDGLDRFVCGVVAVDPDVELRDSPAGEVAAAAPDVELRERTVRGDGLDGIARMRRTFCGDGLDRFIRELYEIYVKRRQCWTFCGDEFDRVVGEL